MTDSTLIEQAKLGDPDAIAALMNQSLQSKGLRAIVDRQGACLEVILEGERVPNRQALTSFVQKGISNLGLQTATPIRSIRISGQQIGIDSPAWVQELQLDPSLDSVIPVDPLSIQSETATSLAIMPGIDDFSAPSIISTSSLNDTDFKAVEWMESDSTPTTDPAALDLEALNDSVYIEEPDFLQELLASSADLPTDESVEPADEGLLDFLNELSGTSNTDPFPDEMVQDLSSFEGASAREEGNFQELFAESTEFTAESELEPWEDSSEALPGGEPDADLLSFLAEPNPEANAAPFNPQLVELHDFPDATSIDQLPESWLNETSNVSTEPLEEPPADFLTSLLDQETNDVPVEPLSATAPEQSVVAESWPEAVPDTGEDLQQSLVNPALADPWAEETFTAEAAPAEPTPVADFKSPEPELPEPGLYDPADYELSSVGLDPEPFPAEPAQETSTWIQQDAGTWIQPDEAETTERLNPFPAEPVAEPATWIQRDELDETLIEEEALPDFLLEPYLDLPATDPAEMTYSEAMQQPDVLDATWDTEEFSLDQSALSLESQSAYDASAATEVELNLDTDAAQASAPPEFSFSEATDEPDPDELPATEVPADLSADPSGPVELAMEDLLTEQVFAAPDAEPDAEPGAELGLTELSTFADQQPTDWGWTETSDLAVEEMPPDFLQELEQEYLTSSPADEAITSPPQPGWDALEADLAAMDLTADLPEEPVAVDSTETLPGDTPVLNLDTWPDLDTAVTEAAAPTVEPDQELELFSETEAGTAVEPPEDWLAALREPAVDLVDLNDSAPEPVVAAEPPAVEVEPVATTPLSSEPVVSNVTQDELEAGLGDFRESFVEPLPQEFFEDIDAQANYPDWRAELSDPLVLSDDGTEAGYIIEDSDEPLPAVLPPAASDESELESDEPRSSEWIFPAVLLTVCGLLAGLLGFSLFSARIGPRQPAPPPAEEPPAPEPAAPSPTSAQPDETWIG